MKYSELRAALKNCPTHGEWKSYGNDIYCDIDYEYHPVAVCVPSPSCREDWEDRLNADYIAAASPEVISALLADYDYQLSRAYHFSELYDMAVNSVCRELEKHGIEEINSPAEAIEVLVSDKDKEIARLREALEMIARIRPCDDTLLSNEDIAMAALKETRNDNKK